MPSQWTTNDLMEMKGRPIYSQDDQKIGKLEDIYLDESSQQPEWIGIGTGIFNTKHVLVPVEGAIPSGDGLRVPYAKDLVKDTPDIDDDELSEDQERELYEHYGMRYQQRQQMQPRQPTMETSRMETSRPEMRTTSSENPSVTRSEEELHVGKREVDAGKARLHKWVETEPVSQDVTLRRETARVEREPINRPSSGAEIGEKDVEVNLRREEPVVQKETVAKERVSLEKEATQQTQKVSDQVRREHVEVDGENLGQGDIDRGDMDRRDMDRRTGS